MRRITASCLLLLSAAVLPAHGQLIINGSFEDASGVGWVGGYVRYSCSLGQGARIHIPTPCTLSGDWALEFATGFGVLSGTGAQVLMVTPGTPVTIEGYIDNGPGGADTTHSGTVRLFDGGTVNPDGSIAGATLLASATRTQADQSPDWQRVQVSGTSSTGTVIVQYVAAGNVGGSTPGAVHFDDFSVIVLDQHPPATPTITEPDVDGKIVNPADVHMESGPFSDPDPGDTHACTDWEIWTVSPAERVWVTSCIGGLEKLHTHLGDGVFEGSHAGRHELLADTDYRLQIRHRDSSGDPASEWSGWAPRLFHTGPATSVFPMDLDDVAGSPPPQWTDTLGADVILPAAAVAPSLRLESFSGQLILEFRGWNGSANQVINPPALAEHIDVRVRLDAGSLAADLVLPESRVVFTDDDGAERTIYLPALSVPPGQPVYLWVSANGSTFYGSESQTEPDFSSLARGAPVPWTVQQPGYVVEVVATGFQLPVNIAFKPNAGTGPNDPYYYVTELYGTIKVVRRSGMVSDYATGLLNFNPTGAFPGSGEQGLTGIVVDPASGDVFAGVLYDSASSPGTHYPKVVRFHSNDGGLTAATQTVILDMVGESQGQSHQISNFSIGPDGKLYVHMGDGFSTATAQNLSSFRGKILRMNLDGTAPVDNPFYSAGDGITARDYVFAYGLRNPFGGAWRASDGRHYEVENGPSVDRFAQIVAGRNYLWSGTDASMLNYAIYNWNPATAPVNIAFIQPGTFGGSGFPADKMDHAFVTESGPTWASGPVSNGKRITEFVLDAAGNRLSGPTPLAVYSGTGKATAVALAAGPDGLYFSDLYKDVDYSSPIDRGANILRIKFVGTASFANDVSSGPAPLSVHFSDTSNTPSPTAWLWDFGDGSTSTVVNPVHTYGAPGLYDVSLRVTAAGGVSITRKERLIHVGVFPRVALIGGSLPPNASDAAVAEHLRWMGMTVDVYDDEPANRPTGAQLAATHDLIVASSTITSANVAGEFASLPVPLLYWEGALNRPEREPLASNATTVDGVTSINILNNTHPVTLGLPAGTVAVFNPAARMSVALGPYGNGVSILATRAGAPGEAAMMAAETGATLLGGALAQARRVFLFIEDTSWLSTTEAGRQLFDQGVLWALGLPTGLAAPDFDRDRDVDRVDFNTFVSCVTGPAVGPPVSGCEAADFDADQDVDHDDFGRLQRCLDGPGLIADPACAD